ncbi:MAG: hypothetical protein M3N52_02460 [Actinomycetota bacterium]|nr:hypothetical protein [Actinomycetota bacterium]
MYQSPDEARSDLFLAGGVYLFGPAVIDILLGVAGINLRGTGGVVLDVVVIAASTVLVPLLLIRYRREPLSMYGLSGGPAEGMGLGLLIAAPIVAATALAGVVSGWTTVPVLTNGAEAVTPVLRGLVYWLCLTLLAVYATVKARGAFRGDPQSVRQGVADIGRWVGIVALVATLLLIAARSLQPARIILPLAVLILLPLGVAGAVLVTLRLLRGPSVTTRPTLLTPVVLLAVSAFNLSLQAVNLVAGAWLGAMVGAVGLIIGALQEQRRSAQAALTLAVALALLTSLGQL